MASGNDSDGDPPAIVYDWRWRIQEENRNAISPDFVGPFCGVFDEPRVVAIEELRPISLQEYNEAEGASPGQLAIWAHSRQLEAAPVKAGRLAAARDKKLPKRQNKTSRRMPPIVNDNGRAFDIWCEIDRSKLELTTATGRQRTALEGHIQRLEAMVAPPKKERALKDRELIVKFCWNHIREHGPPSNIREFIDWLRSKGVLVVERNRRDDLGQSQARRPSDGQAGIPSGRAVVVSDSTVRSILRQVIHLHGRPGRRSKTIKPMNS